MMTLKEAKAVLFDYLSEGYGARIVRAQGRYFVEVV
jgi:hypothetical protein